MVGKERVEGGEGQKGADREEWRGQIGKQGRGPGEAMRGREDWKGKRERAGWRGGRGRRRGRGMEEGGGGMEVGGEMGDREGTGVNREGRG